MKIASYWHGPVGEGVPRVGLVEGDALTPIPSEFGSLREILTAGVLDRLRPDGPSKPLADVHLCAPIPDPSKYLCIGLNYRDHIEERGNQVPDFPVFFNKQVSCINGPYDPVVYPSASRELDYEGELGVVIGRRCRGVAANDAASVIAGYVICNDVSARDWQAKARTMTLGKSFDTHGPFGPWMVTADEIADPHDLSVRTLVNGEVRQDFRTDKMVFDCYQQIEILSTVCTLEPGDVISSGTSSGVGAAMEPPGLLSIGDVVRIEIDGLGHIENEIVGES
ncbi:MAG: fumarylacetoacetate hydrolase family protein [Acidobacteriota bacterium]